MRIDLREGQVRSKIAQFELLAEPNTMQAGHRPCTLTLDGLAVVARGDGGPNEVFA